MREVNYQTGFGNHFASEALPGALPAAQNSPQKVPYNLYAEQISGSAFTALKSRILRSWLYRILPSVKQGEFYAIDRGNISCPADRNNVIPPNQLRWNPLPFPSKKTDFIDGWHTFAVNGNIPQQCGAAIHLYVCNQSMDKRFFYNADGELLVIPQIGKLLFRTEMGLIACKPGEIAVIPRGVKFQVQLMDPQSRGYICENFGIPFTLPERGPIGANGLANERDFQYPLAYFENLRGEFYLDCKFFGHLWRADIAYSPLNVVAWHGNYAPYKYNLECFNTVNSVSFDHPDPSIFTVLTSPSSLPGVANVDFVIFPERWMVAEHTFRLPYYHRNIMSEFMGLIEGVYDAKSASFTPGGASLHNCMSAHGPDANSYKKAVRTKLEPEYYQSTLAFMFESQFVWQPTELSLASPLRQRDYLQCWDGLRARFKPQ